MVGIADDRSTLSSAVAYGVGESDALEELLYLLIEGCTAYNDFVEVATECLDNLLLYLLVHLLAHDRHVQQDAHAVVLYLGEYLLADNLLDNERHSDDDSRLHLGKCGCDDGWRRYACEVEHVASEEEFEHKLKRHAVHVSHRQDADDVVALLDNLAQYR